MPVGCAYPVNHSLHFFPKSQSLGGKLTAMLLIVQSIRIMLHDSSDIERSSWHQNSEYDSFFLHKYNQHGCLIGYWMSEKVTIWVGLKLQKIAIDAVDRLVSCKSVF